MEGFPSHLSRRLNEHRKAIARVAPPPSLPVLESVIIKANRWKPGDTITCAFSGGSNALRDRVAAAANAWGETGANIKFSFKDEHGKYREWRHTDLSYAADVRIGFDQEGYWSLVGAQSIDASIIGAHESSMNFSGFAQNLPNDYAATVMHEFGHALGFEHEHASPAGGCDAQFRWNDDPGYVPTTDDYGQYVLDASGRRPGIYTVLGGPPNGWDRAKVDFNLRQLKDSSAYMTSAFDNRSIMKYYFEAWMFVQGTNCTCYSTQNLTLSHGDIAGVRAAYPPISSAPSLLLDAAHANALDTLVASTDAPEPVRARLAARRSALVA